MGVMFQMFSSVPFLSLGLANSSSSFMTPSKGHLLWEGVLQPFQTEEVSLWCSHNMWILPWYSGDPVVLLCSVDVSVSPPRW